MDYWTDTMQDDVYLIAASGWVEAAKPQDVLDHRGKNIRETPDLTIKRRKYRIDLVPPALVAPATSPASRPRSRRYRTGRRPRPGSGRSSLGSTPAKAARWRTRSTIRAR